VPLVNVIDPLQDARWPQFLESRHDASLFHSTEWLDALRRTYGFQPCALTTSRPWEPLINGLVFCRVQSWITGRRLISVPFSDHCTPLVDDETEFEPLLSGLQEEASQGKQYLEIRSIAGGAAMAPGLTVSGTFCLHRLDLRPTLDELFRTFHGSCIRRRIKRAEREGLRYDDGTSEEQLHGFYQLVVRTRRRQGIPPQPLSWFRNLIACHGENLKIRLACHNGQPVAGILTIRYKSTMTYKYGCSDPEFHHLGPMQLLMWTAIRQAKVSGLLEFDMGRTDWSNEGLLTFKDRWGANRSTLLYLRYPALTPPSRTQQVAARVAKWFMACAPDRVVTAAGSILYPHFA
jgi:CelD/BcsL family acetyltransferase involved in cellulose biosynthesis